MYLYQVIYFQSAVKHCPILISIAIDTIHEKIYLSRRTTVQM